MKRQRRGTEVAEPPSPAPDSPPPWVGSMARALAGLKAASFCTPVRAVEAPQAVEWPAASVLLQTAAKSRRAYYHHLRHVVSTALTHPHTQGLLTPEEQALAGAYLALDLPAASLLARLSGRRGPWFLTASFNGFREVLEQDAAVPADDEAEEEEGAEDEEGSSSSAGPERQQQPSSTETAEDEDIDMGVAKTDAAVDSSDSAAPPPAPPFPRYDKLPWTPTTWRRVQQAVGALLSAGMLLEIPSDSDIASLARATAGAAGTRLSGSKRPREAEGAGTVTPACSGAHTQLTLVLEAAKSVLSTPEAEALALRLGVKLSASQAQTARATYNQRTGAGAGGATGSASGVGSATSSEPNAAVTRGVTDTKSLVFEALSRRVLTQRTVTGGYLPLSKELLRVLQSKLLPLEPDPVAPSPPHAVADNKEEMYDDEISIVEPEDGGGVSASPAAATATATPWWKRKAAESKASAATAATPSGKEGTKLIWVAGKPKFVPVRTPGSGGNSSGKKGGGNGSSPGVSKPLFEGSGSSDTGMMSSSSSSSSGVASGYGPSDHLLVRLHPQWTSLVRIAYTLFYVATGTAHLSSGMGTGNWPVIPLAAPTAPAAAVAASAEASAAAASAAGGSSSGVIDLLDDDEEEATVPPAHTTRLYPRRPVLMSVEDVLSSAQAAAQGWGPGSGSRYADLGATKDTYLPRGAGAGAGNVFLAVPTATSGPSNGSGVSNGGGPAAPVARFSRSDASASSLPSAAALTSAGLGAAGTSLNTLYSPGLLHVFRRVDFAPVTCSRSVCLFSSRDHLRALGAAHVFRAQVDVSGVLGLAPFVWKPDEEEEQSEEEEAGTATATGGASADAAVNTSVVDLVDSQASAAPAPAPAPTAKPVSGTSNNNGSSAPVNAVGWAVPTGAKQVQQLAAPPPVAAPGLPQHCMGLQLLPYAPLLSAATAHYTLDHWRQDFGEAAAVPPARVIDTVRGITQQESGEGDCAAVQPEHVGAASTAYMLLFASGALLSGVSGVECRPDARTAAAIASAPAPVKVALRASLCLALTALADAAGETPVSRHPWLHQYSPGSLFSTILWEAVDPLERSRRYDLAVLALTQLVDTPFTPHRSGRWYDRLGLDLEHLGLHADALAAVERGLASPAVRAGERIALRQRQVKLVKRGQAKVAAKTGRKAASAGVGKVKAKAAAGAARKRRGRAKDDDADEEDEEEDDEEGEDDEDDDGIVVLKDDAEPQQEGTGIASTKAVTGAVAATTTTAASPKLPNLEDDVRTQEAVMAEALAAQAGGKDRELPLFHVIKAASVAVARAPVPSDRPVGGSWEAVSAPVPDSPAPLCVDVINANPLNRDTGVKSRYMSGIDVENDMSQEGCDASQLEDELPGPPSSGWVNVTDALCSSFGWSYKGHSPWKPVYQQAWGKGSSRGGGLSRPVSPAVVETAGEGAGEEGAAAADTDAVVAASAGEGSSDATGTSSSAAAAGPWKRYGYRKPWDAAAAGRRPEDVPSFNDFLSLRISVEALALARYWLGEDEDQDAGSTEAAGAAFTRRGWRGHHCEGVPLYSLFALLMWEVLFLPLPDVFLTPYQDSPLDLDFSGVFHGNRVAALTARLTWMAQASGAALAEEVAACWQRHYGRQARGLRWDAHPLPLLQLLAIGLGGPALAVICDAMAFNHKQCQAGFPDLLLWRVWAPAEAAAALANAGSDGAAAPPLALPPGSVVQMCVVEVKGGSDRLSEKQHHWIRVLRAAGVNVRLCKVATAPGAKRGGKAKAKEDAEEEGELL